MTRDDLSGRTWRSLYPERNWEITSRVIAGETYAAVAKDYDISSPRVRQIIFRVCRVTYPDLYARCHASEEGGGGRWHPPIGALRRVMHYLFTEERTMSENPIPYTPIKGYRELDAEEIADMNRLKEVEAMVLATIALLRDATKYDPRWIAIGQTHIEQGFMALNRSVVQPHYIEPPAVITNTRPEPAVEQSNR